MGAASHLEEVERLAGLGSWTWRAGDAFLLCSAGLVRLLGKGQGAAALSLRDCLGSVHAADRRPLFDHVRGAQRSGQARFEFRVVSDGKEVGIVCASLRWGFAEDGSPILWGVCQDTTPTRRVKAALDRSESRWEKALETARQGVWDADHENKTYYHSRTWRLIRGLDPDDPAGDTHEAWIERLHPDDRERVLKLIDEHYSMQPEQFQLEYRERHRDGHYIWISSLGAPIEWWPDGTPKRVTGTDTDITQRKLAEENVARLSRRLELALEVSRIGVFEADLQDGRLFWDERVRQMYGTPRDNFEIAPNYWEQTLHPEDAERAQQAVLRAIESQGEYNSEFRIIRADGEIRTIRTCGAFYRDSNGRPKMLGANWDVTDEVAAKRDLERAKSLAEARNVELEAARARAHRAQRAARHADGPAQPALPR